MKRIDEREAVGASHFAPGLVPGQNVQHASTMMVDAIIDELAEMDVDLNTITLEEMKRLFADACRDA